MRKIPLTRLLSTVCILSLMSGCATSHLQTWPWQTPAYETEINDKLSSGTFYLNQSLYLSDLYDDDRIDLATALKPSELELLRGLGGKDVPAPEPHGVLAPGTEVQITRIEWPGSNNMWKRPLFTPRYHTWVYLTAAAARGQTSLQHKKPIIILVPPSFRTEEEVMAWLKPYLSSEDVTGKFNQLRAEIRHAIEEKKIVEGMGEEEVRFSWGVPNEVIHLGDAERQKIYLYGQRRVIMRNGKVASVIVR